MFRSLTAVVVVVAAFASPASAQMGCSSYGGPCGGRGGFYQMVPGPSGPNYQSFYAPGGGPTMFVPQQQTRYYNNMPIDAATCNAMRAAGMAC